LETYSHQPMVLKLQLR